MKQIHIKLPELLHRDLRIQAAIKEQTLQDYVVEAIKNKIALDKSTSTKESTGDNDTK